MYEKALFEVNARSANSSTEAALGHFITEWINLEKALRTIMEKQGIKPYPSGLSNQTIQKALSGFQNNYEIYGEFVRLRHMRNNVVHGAEIPDIETLNKAAQSLTDLLKMVSLSNAEDELGSDQSV